MSSLPPLLSFLACLGLTPCVRRLAAARGWMAQPRGDRWHATPTALMGGIAIYIGVGAPLLMLADFGSLLKPLEGHARALQPPSLAATLFLGGSFLFVLGLLDDFISLKAHVKLLGQIVVAAVVTFLGFRLQWFHSLTLDTVVTLVWIVGITNAFNLLDNMDGLCAGIGMIAALYMAVLFAGSGAEAAAPALCLAGALAAFLVFNFNPASIFMGDSGSLVIGFCLAVLALNCPEHMELNRLSLFAVPVMVLMVPILDTTLVTLIRLLSGRKASTGGKDHTSHRLVLMGFSERTAVLLLYGVGAVSGLAAIFVSRHDTLTSPAVIVPIGVSLLLMGIYLAQIRVYPEKEFSLLRGRSYTPILLELTYKRQLLLVTLDFGLVAFAYYLSYRLRFDAEAFSKYFKVFLSSLPAVVACKFAAFYFLGIYRGLWDYLSTGDAFNYLKASLLGTLLAVATVTYIYRFEDFSKGIFIIDWLLVTTFLLTTRGSFRLFTDAMKRRTLTGDPVLIYGAGRGGELLLREILNNRTLGIKPLGFLDDDPLKSGKKIQGYPILGSLQQLPDLLKRWQPTGLLVSFSDSKTDQLGRVAALCRRNGLFLKRFELTLKDVIERD